MEGSPALKKATQVVIDASVALKWFVRAEENTERALTLRKAHVEGKISILAPMLLPYEVGNVLRYNPEFDEASVKEAVRSLFLLEIRYEEPTGEGLSETISLAFKNKITVYDATYLSLAKNKDVKLVTADKSFKEKILADETVVLLESDAFFKVVGSKRA